MQNQQQGMIALSQQAVASYFLINLRQAAQNNDPTLRKLGYSDALIDDIKSMSAQDMDEFAKYCNRFVKIAIDEQQFDQVKRIIGVKKDEQALIDSLLLAQTPNSFISEYFGLDSNDISIARRRLQVSQSRSGRGRLPSAEETAQICETAKSNMNRVDKTSSYYYPRLVLMVSETLNLDVNLILKVIDPDMF